MSIYNKEYYVLFEYVRSRLRPMIKDLFLNFSMHHHIIGATVKNLHDQKSRAREQLFTPITFAKKNFLLLHAKNKYKIGT